MRTEKLNTLIDALDYYQQKNVEKVTLIYGSDDENVISYYELKSKALCALYTLQALGLKPDDELLFQVEDQKSFIILFWACIFGGIIPVPVAVGHTDENRYKLLNILNVLNKPNLIIEKHNYLKLKNYFSINNVHNSVIIIAEDIIDKENKKGKIVNRSPSDIAFIQFSSGSTGSPKGVILTHENLITNIRDIVRCAVFTKKDSMLCWMPLTHDMGLIGFHLLPVVFGINHFIIPTKLFVKRPLLWLEKTSEHCISLLSSPNFGYKYVLNAFVRKSVDKIDLSCVRLIFNGAEPISYELCCEFTNYFKKYGLKKNAMFPVYGLAEASLAVSFSIPEEETKCITISRKHLGIGDNVLQVSADYNHAQTFVDVGKALCSTEIRIIDKYNQKLKDQTIGHVQISGKNVTAGYYNNPETTKKIIAVDGWLYTGDLGFLKDGRLFITGREKDIIFKAGINIYSHDIERIAQQADGFKPGKVAAIGVFNSDNHEDEIIVFLKYKKNDFHFFYTLVNKLKKEISIKVGIIVDHVIPVNQIPRTTSGKIKRFKLKESFIAGEYDNIIKKLKAIGSEKQNIKAEDKKQIDPEKVTDLVVQQIEKTLKFKIDDFNEKLTMLGVDSIKVPGIQKLLEDTFKIELPVSVVFDYPTINKLADYIKTKLSGETEGRIDKSTDIVYEPDNDDNSIAIIGVACNFPGGADTPEKFWKLLLDGTDAISGIPERLLKTGHEHNIWQKQSVENIPEYGGFLNDIYMFDPLFFGITPAEAQYIDPQQRLLLEICFKAIENSGINIKKLEGSRTGVFIGQSSSDYLEFTTADKQTIGSYSIIGSIRSTSSGRISYTFGLKGPSITMDTACSSSLVAIDQAKTSLNTNNCDLAIAGGVNLILSPKGYIGLSKLNALSEDGRCKSFDNSADGYGRSEGCGVVILKRYSDSIKDNDNILAVIKGSCVNHNGNSSGLTVPNGLAQENVIKQAIKQSNLTPSDIDYIEAHGSGTKLGDPQEITALCNVFKERARKKKLLVGSVKANIGHTESAAGIAGLIKVILALKNRILPGHIQFSARTSLINWNESPLDIEKENIKWVNNSRPRIAGISSFGISGTNSHIILQEPPETKHETAGTKLQFFILSFSAKTKKALKDLVLKYINYLSATKHNIEDICYTSNISRTAFKYKLAVVADSKKAFKQKLLTYIENPEQEGMVSSGKHNKAKKVVFLFSGPGALDFKIVKEFYNTYSVFKSELDKCDYLFKKYCNFHVVNSLFSRNKSNKVLNKEENARLIFSYEYAIARLWESWGVYPDTVIGHGIGEYAAACYAGAFNLEDAVILLSFKKEKPAIEFLPFQIPFVSTRAGKFEKNQILKKEYRDSLSGSFVNFDNAIKTVKENCFDIVLELGGVSVFSKLNSFNNKTVFFSSHLRKGNDSRQQILFTLSQLYLNGYEVDWDKFHCKNYFKKIILPNYPLVKKKYKIESASENSKNIYFPDDDIRIAKTKETELTDLSNLNIKSGKSRGGSKISITDNLKEIVSMVSGLEVSDIDEETHLFSLGLDSIMLFQFRKRILDKYSIDITVKDFLKKLTNISKLSSYISENLPEEKYTDNSQFISETAGNDSLIEKTILNQLELMNRQLDILNGNETVLKNATDLKQKILSRIGNKKSNKIIKTVNSTKINNKKNKLRSMKFKMEKFTDIQKEFIDNLIKTFNKTRRKSKDYAGKYRSVFSDWIMSLNFNLSLKELLYPIVCSNSKGSRFYDIDGNEYIDISMSYGVSYFGHKPEFIVDAVKAQLDNGFELGPQKELTGKAAELLSEMTGVERVAFCNTGSEAVMVALRLARSVTRRNLVVRFAGSFHGNFDGVLAEAGEDKSYPLSSGTPQGMVDDVIVLHYGAEHSLQKIEEHADQIAAVLVEPVQSRNPGFHPKKFLKKLREITAKSGIALIFDEMITGFRILPGGAQKYFDINADIVTYGKIVGGGLPIGIVAGKSIYLDAVDGGMWKYGDDSEPDKETAFFAGTFCKHPLAIAAVYAVLNYLKEKGPKLQESINQRTQKFADYMNKYFEEEMIPLHIDNFGSLFQFMPVESSDMILYTTELQLFFLLLMQNGVYIWERRICFLSTAHTDADVDIIIKAISKSINELRAGGFSFKRKSKNSDRYLPMSSVQKRIFTLCQVAEGEQAYHISEVLKIEGNINIEKFELVLKKMISRHETFRTGFEYKNGDFVQRVKEKVDFSIIYKKEPKTDIDELIKKATQKFNLNNPPLFRVTIIETSSSAYYMILDFHHSIIDGYSLIIFINDFIRLYMEDTLEPVKMQYGEYIKWEKNYIESDSFHEHRKFWEDQLRTDLPILNLPVDYKRPLVKDYLGKTLRSMIDKDKTAKLNQIAKEYNVSLYMLLLSVYYIMLSRLSGQNDIVIGTPIAVRDAGGDYSNSIGMYTNTLVLRNYPDAAKTFKNFINEVKESCLKAYSNKEFPYEYMVDAVSPKRDISRNPLYDIEFIYENANDRELKLEDLVITTYKRKISTSMFDLSMEVVQQSEVLNIGLNYASSLFKEETIQRWSVYFETLLDDIITNNGSILLSELNMLPEYEKNKILRVFNSTKIDYKKDKIIHKLFEEQVVRTPDNIALCFKSKNLTYNELNTKANRLAHILIESGVKAESIIGIMTEPSPETVIGIFGILKAGGAYLPIDPKYPKERINYMMSDCSIKTLVTQSKYKNEFPDLNTFVIDESVSGDTEVSNPVCRIKENNLAYIIYTSGSTGKPKGVMIEHGSAVNLINAVNDKIEFNQKKTIVVLATMCFDIFFLETILSLTKGVKIIIADKEEQLDPELLSKLISEYKINMLQMTPTRMRLMCKNPEILKSLNKLKDIILTGESLPESLFHKIKNTVDSDKVNIYNLYGPTEATIYSSLINLSAHNHVTIGSPIANTRMYILNKEKNPQPIGVYGELYIAGLGLARGYRNLKELTSEKFTENPFEPGERIFRTGDIARWLPDGNIDILGRIDYQVKIRGFRIELEEIELILKKYENIKEAVVIDKEDKDSEKHLIAYYVADTVLSKKKLREFLAVMLPDYMIPSFFVKIDSIPLNKNGKLDRNALPEIYEIDLVEKTELIMPRNKTEKTIAGIWSEVLKINDVGIDVNFFDLGGNSFKLVEVHSRLKTSFSKNVSIVDLFKYTTIKSLAPFFDNDDQQNTIDENSIKSRVNKRRQARSQKQRRKK